MLDIIDHLLADAVDLVHCSVDPTGQRIQPDCQCAGCEWQRNYRRYIRDRENGELDAIAQRIIAHRIEKGQAP